MIDFLIETARAVTWKAAAEFEPTEPWRRKAVIAKSVGMESAVKISDLAIRALGGIGFFSKLPAERYFRDARAGLLHPLNTDDSLEYIGKKGLEVNTDNSLLWAI